MGAQQRPVPDRPEDREEQAAHLVRTDNGPSVEGEEQVIREQFGAPDMAGFYRTPAEPADDPADAADKGDSEADNGDQAAEDAEGGDQS